MSSWLTPLQLRQIFEQEISSAAGTVQDVFADFTRLFARAVLPPLLEVGPRDNVQGGVALRATATDIFVHPYVFRLICTNGAIMPQIVGTQHFSRDDCSEFAPADELEAQVSVAIQGCCSSDAFTASTDDIRASAREPANLAIMIASLSHGELDPALFDAVLTIMDRFGSSDDQSSFGLMNAVTAHARQVRDPETRWKLEELGGSVPSLYRRARVRTVQRRLVRTA